MKGKSTVRGVCFALSAGIGWGFSGTVCQYLLVQRGVDSGWLTVVRMLLAGMVLVAYTALRNPRSISAFFRQPRDILQMALFGVFGLMFVQYTYTRAISLSNAGAATAVQYLGQIWILLYACLSLRRFPRSVEILALLLALGGVFLLATHGNLNDMAMSKEALFWALSSSVALALYTLLPVPLIPKYGSQCVGGFGLLMGGTVLGLLLKPWRVSVPLDGSLVLAIAALILFGTILGFTLYLTSIQDIGGVKAGLLASVETLAAPLFSMLWLRTKFVLLDYVGFFCILAMVALLALPELSRELRQKRGAGV